MTYVVDVRLSSHEQDELMKLCPFGTWRSTNGVDFYVEFSDLDEAERFQDNARNLGCPTSEVRQSEIDRVA